MAHFPDLVSGAILRPAAQAESAKTGNFIVAYRDSDRVVLPLARGPTAITVYDKDKDGEYSILTVRLIPKNRSLAG